MMRSEWMCLSENASAAAQTAVLACQRTLLESMLSAVMSDSQPRSTLLLSSNEHGAVTVARVMRTCSRVGAAETG